MFWCILNLTEFYLPYTRTRCGKMGGANSAGEREEPLEHLTVLIDI